MSGAQLDQSAVVGIADEYHEVGAGHAGRPAFAREEFAARLAAVQAAMADQGLDGLLVHTPENIYYLTGYETSGYFEYQALVVPAIGEPQLLIRNVERLNVDEYSWLPGAHIWKDGSDFLDSTRALVGATLSGRRVGLEKHSWFVTAALAEALATRMAAYTIVDAGRLVETIRLVKSSAEIGYMREAGRLADIAMGAAIDAVAEGATELDVAAAAHDAAIRAGSEYPALPHYVSSGYRADIGHAHWTDRRLERGDLVKLEFLGTKRRYHAGLTRPVTVGPAQGEVVRDVATCVSVQDETFAALRPGVTADSVVRVAHAALSAAGRPAFRIRLGYSMGIGFPPIAGEGQTADLRDGDGRVLVAGMVFHMLSVLRVGLVVSDTVLITDSGHERLTRTERRLFTA
jgi:Xaa-Pro dipeptidase